MPYADKNKRKAFNAEYYLKNKEKALNQIKTWRSSDENRKRRNARAREIYDAKKDYERKREWLAKNKAKSRMYTMNYNASKLRATPQWANGFFIEEIYDLAERRTKCLGMPYHVDHIVPLRGKTVCGLHVENNMQIISQEQNRSKSNRHWPDMP